LLRVVQCFYFGETKEKQTKGNRTGQLSLFSLCLSIGDMDSKLYITERYHMGLR